MKLDDETILSNGDCNIADLEELDDPPASYPDGWFIAEREQIIFSSALAPGEIEHVNLSRRSQQLKQSCVKDR
jgi:hypothetical protein